ncbi:Dyp-type peroxidase [Collimonas pratensis]|uniref:Dyp-type peroxidase n=1 Tax=Collimonas pratensis TaxID=279113 RepID=UPI001E322EF0|nr:Dyp-type peroxidase [Collimonas pratensis]
MTRAVFGQIATITLHDHSAATEAALLSLVRTLAEAAKASPAKAGLVAAFDPGLWGRWHDRAIPVARTVLNSSPKLRDSGGDVLLYLKADNAAAAAQLMESVRPGLQALAAQIEILAIGKRTDGKVMGGRYLDGITNPSDPVSLAADILVDGEFRGACYGFTQKFLFEWSSIGDMLPDAQDAMLGRDPAGAILPQHDHNAHIRRVHVLDSNGDNLKLLRQALPFGEHAGSAAREKGLMFVAFCNDQPRFETIIKHMMGELPDRPADRLMSVVQGIAGSYWYVPNAQELNVPAAAVDDVQEDPHWQVRSKNGYLFYNGQDYLHQMSEGKYVAGDPPSPRLLALLGRAFSHWNDGWLKRNPFPRLPHLSQLVSEVEAPSLTASVALRKALANHKTLAGLLSSRNPISPAGTACCASIRKNWWSA